MIDRRIRANNRNADNADSADFKRILYSFLKKIRKDPLNLPNLPNPRSNIDCYK